MKFTTASPGRIFILRLEDGEILHETIESFAAKQGIRAAALIVLGGADEGSTLVVGPEKSRATPVNPMEHILAGTSEAAGCWDDFSRFERQARFCTCISPAAGKDRPSPAASGAA